MSKGFLRAAGQHNDRITSALAGKDRAVRRWGEPRRDMRDEAQARDHERQPATIDLSRVRIHADEEADELAGELGATAFTRGHDFYFRRGAWRPGSPLTNQLLAHESVHVAQQKQSGAASIQCYSDTDILPDLEQPVAATDTKAQRERVERLARVFEGFAMWEAADVLARITARKPGDRLAVEFHYRLSTKSREMLIAILRRRASTVPLVEVSKPSDDPKFVDNVLEEVRLYMLFADRYTLKWPGGKTTIHNDDIDWSHKSHALPTLDIYESRKDALAAAATWFGQTPGYDKVCTYYRGPAGVVLPIWFSKETAPKTYEFIMSVHQKMGEEAAAWEDFFRSFRNGMIVGAAVGGILRLTFFRGSSGGGSSKDPAPKPRRVGEPPVEPPVTATEPPVGASRPAEASSTKPAGVKSPKSEAAPPRGSSRRPHDIAAREAATDEYLLKQGRRVEKNVLEQQEGAGRQGDRIVDGVKTEYKHPDPGADSGVIKNAVNNSVRKGGQARRIIFDARGTGLTEQEAVRGIERAMGIARGKIDVIEVIGDGYHVKN